MPKGNKKAPTKVVKIQDGTIIKKESLKGYHKEKYDPKACHLYIAIFNEKKNRYDMYPTSHYVDPKKEADIRNNRAILVKIKGVKGKTTAYKIARTKDVNGQPFKDNVKNAEFVGQLTRRQQKKFKKFINKKTTPKKGVEKKKS